MELLRTATVLFFTALLGAQDYYISPSGDDIAHDGMTVATAWRTIGKVNSRAVSPRFNGGDRILFEGGQAFTDARLFIYQGGFSDVSRLVIGSYGTGRAILRRAHTQNPDLYAAIELSGVAGVTIQDLELAGPGLGDFDGTAYGSLSSGSWVKGAGCSLSCGSGIKRGLTLRNLVIHGFYNGVSLQGYGSGSVNGKGGFDDVLIQDCVVYGNDNGGIHTGSFPEGSKANTNIRIINTTVYGNPGQTYPSPTTGSGIHMGGVTNGLIDGCVAHDNGGKGDAQTGGGPVGIWAYDSDRVTIQNCLVYNQKTSANRRDGGGFDLDIGVTNSVIQYCYAYNCYGPGYMICELDGGRTNSDNHIRYNISWRNGQKKNSQMGSGLHIYCGTTSHVRNIWAYNNLDYSDGFPGGGSESFGKCASVSIHGANIRNVNIWNNILVVKNTYPFIRIDPGAYGEVRLQGNDYWATDGNFGRKVMSFGVVTAQYGGWFWGNNWDTSHYTSLSALRGATGGLSPERIGATNTGLQVDPGIANIAGVIQPITIAEMNALTAFRLPVGSPMIDAGLNLATRFGATGQPFAGQTVGVRDFTGLPVPHGVGFDIGACESGAAQTSAPTVQSINATDPTRPIFAGTATAGATITVYNGGTMLGTTTADLEGNWSWTPSAALGQGTYSLSVTARVAGQVESSATLAGTLNVPMSTYVLTVTNGTGSGSYPAGLTHTIVAAAAPPGRVFLAWTGTTSALASSTSSTTTVTMPASAVTVAATYVPIPAGSYVLMVNGGTGGGAYAAGTAHTIVATAAPAGQAFLAWTGTTSALASSTSSTTIVTMPASAVTVTATYVAISVTPHPQLNASKDGGHGCGLGGITAMILSLSLFFLRGGARK